MKKRALLVIDVQNDFCAGGSLAVPDGNAVVPVINALMSRGKYDQVVFSQDWHPADHGSFASQHPGKKPFEMGKLGGQPQVMWPDHCVQGTKGAEFHPDLLKSFVNFIQQKGTDKTADSYSAFRDNNSKVLTGLAAYLKKQGIEELDVCGLATDYCVVLSALDARGLLPGLKVSFIEDASRGIDPAGVDAAKRKMKIAGINIIKAADRLPPPPTTKRQFTP
jgi:nicotinamidase/pyrazinamidase